jgi:hypothetical protein
VGFIVTPPAGTVQVAGFQRFPITALRIERGGFTIEAEAVAEVEIPGGEHPWILLGEDGVMVQQRATEPLLLADVRPGDTVKVTLRTEA